MKPFYTPYLKRFPKTFSVCIERAVGIFLKMIIKKSSFVRVGINEKGNHENKDQVMDKERKGEKKRI